MFDTTFVAHSCAWNVVCNVSLWWDTATSDQIQFNKLFNNFGFGLSRSQSNPTCEEDMAICIEDIFNLWYN